MLNKSFVYQIKWRSFFLQFRQLGHPGLWDSSTISPFDCFICNWEVPLEDSQCHWKTKCWTRDQAHKINDHFCLLIQFGRNIYSKHLSWEMMVLCEWSASSSKLKTTYRSKLCLWYLILHVLTSRYRSTTARATVMTWCQSLASYRTMRGIWGKFFSIVPTLVIKCRYQKLLLMVKQKLILPSTGTNKGTINAKRNGNI